MRGEVWEKEERKQVGRERRKGGGGRVRVRFKTLIYIVISHTDIDDVILPLQLNKLKSNCYLKFRFANLKTHFQMI